MKLFAAASFLKDMGSNIILHIWTLFVIGLIMLAYLKPGGENEAAGRC